MANFVTQFHSADIKDVFKAYCVGMAKYYAEYCEHATEEECERVIDNFNSTCEIHHFSIMNALAGEIARYMNYYNINAREGVDEFKIIYFMGMRLAAFLDQEGHTLEAKVVLYAMVIMLDYRLKSVTKGKGRPELKDRLKLVIRHGKIPDKFGSDGLYFIYKCSYNMLKEAAASAPSSHYAPLVEPIVGVV